MSSYRPSTPSLLLRDPTGARAHDKGYVAAAANMRTASLKPELEFLQRPSRRGIFRGKSITIITMIATVPV